MASDATAYLEVTFTKRIQKQSNFSDTALAGNFKIESTIASTTTVIPIVKAIIISNKLRLQIADADVPKQQTSITLTYTDNSGNNGVSLVDATTGFPIKDLVPVKDAVKTEVETPIGPSIVGAVVKHESPNKITLTFTEKRDVITNSLSTKDPASGNNDVKCGYGIGYNNDANFNLGDKGAYVTPTFDVNGTSSTAMNKIILTTNTGEFQYGSTVSLTGGGVENGIGDQFDLSCVEFTEFNVTNNVEQVILDGAYITNTDPSSVLLYFKKRTSDTILDISAEYISTTIPQAGVFQCEMFNIQDENHTAKYDISGVDSVKYSDTELINAGFSSTLANKYHDISGVRFMLNDWPFQYNSPVKILFDISGDVPNTCKLEDQYGNKIFNSAYDPKSGTGNDISWCTVTNNIQGIKIKSGNNLSNNTGDLSYNIILDFTTETGTSGISGELIGTPVPGEFKLIKNHGNPFEVDKAKAIVIDVSKVQIWVDYSKNTFDKIINKGETIKLQYNPTTTWPSSIKDEYGNYVRKVTEPAIDIVNNMDYSGNLPGSTSVESDGKTINFDCGFDISVNDTDSFTGTGGFTFSAGLDPTGVIVETIEKGDDDKTMKLTLSKPLYATSLPTLNYSNSSGVTFTDCYGIKLKNKTGISVSVSNIPAPGREESSWIDNSGVAYNTLGKLDLSFNPTIDSFSSDNRSGFKYQASYVEHNSTFADLSTDGYVDIPASNITFDDNTGIITLDTGFNQAGASRGFSKKHTSTDCSGFP